MKGNCYLLISVAYVCLESSLIIYKAYKTFRFFLVAIMQNKSHVICNVIQCAVSIFCVGSTCYFVRLGWKICEANEDLARIEFRDYNNAEYISVIPTATLCFSRETVYPNGDFERFKDGLNPLFDPTTLSVPDFLVQFGILTTTELTIWTKDEQLKDKITFKGINYRPLESFKLSRFSN